MITYLEPRSFLRKTFAFIIFVFSFFVVYYQSILMGGFMLSFSVYLASSTGSQIDLAAHRYRTIWSIFALHFGRWKPLPDFEYISVFKGRTSQRMRSISASLNTEGEAYLVNLFYDRNQRITFYRTEDKEDAFRAAKHFNQVLELDILDATEREQKWL